jgi:hypothetical protein
MGIFTRMKEKMQEEQEIKRQANELERKSYNEERIKNAPKLGRIRAQREYKEQLSNKRPTSGFSGIENAMGNRQSLLGGNPFGGPSKRKTRLF